MSYLRRRRRTAGTYFPAGTNLLTNPAFVIDSNADGLADSYSTDSANATVVTTLVDRTIGDRAVRAQKVKVTGGVGVYGYFNIASGPTTDAGTFASGEYVTLSVYLKVVELTGATIQLGVVNRNAAAGALAVLAGSSLTAADTDFVRRTYTTVLSHADTSRISILIRASDNTMHSGDVVDIECAWMQVEKATAATAYFDGSSPLCYWTGTANASTSVRNLHYGPV